jgi:hypothetical protein
MHPESVLAHAQPMPLESEEHSVRHTDGAEHAPTAEQANLAGREGFLVGVHNVGVMQDEAVHT